MIEVQINGERRQASHGQPMLELISGLGIGPDGILIERNGEALLRSEWEQIRLAEGDRLEVLRVVAGG